MGDKKKTEKPEAKPQKPTKGSGKTYRSHMELFNELAKVKSTRGQGCVSGTGVPKGT